MPNTEITALSFGGGQDSTALLYKFCYDNGFRERYLKGELIVIMSDTGNEYPETYEHVKEAACFCEKHGILFAFLTTNEEYICYKWAKFGYHGRTWQSLQGQYRLNGSIMSVAMPRTCTSNLKIEPFYRYLAQYLADKYGFEARYKKCFKQYFEVFSKLNVVIGFAKGEEARQITKPKCGQWVQQDMFGTQKPPKDPLPKWRREYVEQRYPLIDLGVDRITSQKVISSYGHNVPPPSNCMMCPFADNIELLYIYRLYPEMWASWVEYERTKLGRVYDKPSARNLGVKGEKSLEQVLQEAIRKFGYMSDDELRMHRFSHGHCVKSKY